jgi:uncharacterized protein
VTPVEFGFVFGVLAAAAALQSGIGFGMNLLAAPLVAIVEPRLVPGPLLLAAVLLTVLIAIRDRADVDWPGFGWVMTGRLPGTVAGALVVASISADGVALAVGLSVIGAVVLNVVDFGLRPTRPTLLVAGVVSGFAGTVSSIGGPPLAVVYAGQRGPVIRGTLSTIFVVGGLISLASLLLVGRMGFEEVRLGLLVLPATVVGFVASRRLAAHLDDGRTRIAVLSVSAMGAIAAIAAAVA